MRDRKVRVKSYLGWFLALALSATYSAAQNQPKTPSTAPQQQESQQVTPQPVSASAPESAPAPPRIVLDTAAKINGADEIVITAVGDVMLGTTFPDESTLPPNDGADLLADVTPFLKHGDVVYGNLEGPIVDGGESAKCRGKKEGTCYAFRVPT